MKHSQKMIVLDSLIRASFYALIFFLPISIALVSTCSGFAIFFFLVKRALVVKADKIKGQKMFMAMVRPPESFLNKPMGYFILAVTVSVIFSQDHSLSIVAFVGKILRGVFLYSSFLEAFTTTSTLNNFIFIWLTSAFLTAASGLHQYIFGIDFLRNLPLDDGRVSSSLRQANDFGAYLVSITPLVFAMFIYWKFLHAELKKNAKGLISSPAFVLIFCCVAYAALIVCLGFTFSRGSWIAFFIAMIFVGLYKKETLPIVFLIVAGFILVFSPVMVHTRDVSLMTDNVVHIEPTPVGVKPVVDRNIFDYIYHRLGSGRWGFWKEAVQIIKMYPVWGSGLNTYSEIGSRLKFHWGGYPHNSFLQLTAELGFLGLGTFLWMIFILYQQTLTQIIRMSQGYLRCISIGVLGGLSAYLIQSFFDTTFFSVQLSVLMWIMIAVLVAANRMNQLTKA